MKLLNSSLLKYAASVYCNILNFMMFSDMFHDINYLTAIKVMQTSLKDTVRSIYELLT